LRIMYNHDISIEKFKKLYHRIINYMNANEDDVLWCGRMLEDVEGGIIPKKINLLAANKMWKKYEA